MGTECTWYGVTCTNSHVAILNLNTNNLTGQIPSEIGNLSALWDLRLHDNQLTGPIPSSLAGISALKEIRLMNNQMTGGIPPEFGSIPELIALNFSNNQLTGGIPAELGNLATLQRLRLAQNKLTGSIPPELGNLLALQIFELNQNQLSGPIPPQLALLTSLLNANSDFRWNALYTDNTALRDFLNLKQIGGNWENTQTVVPTNIAVSGVTNNSATLSWTPIAYTADTGRYEVYYSIQPAGPYTLFTTTGNKTASSATVTGLNENTKYYFKLRTVTNAHANNQNTVYSRPTNGGLHAMYVDGSNGPPVTQSIRYLNKLISSWSMPQTPIGPSPVIDWAGAVSVAVDQAGIWHAVYTEETAGGNILKYKSAITVPTTLVADQNPAYAAIAVDKNGKLHVMYTDGSSGPPATQSVKYMNNLSGNWSTPQIVAGPTLVEDWGGSVSLAVDQDGTWHAVYIEEPVGAGILLKYKSAVTAPITLVADPEAWSSSIAIDPNGKLHVMYVVGSAGPPTTQSIMYLNNLSGSWSVPQAVVVSSPVEDWGGEASIGVDQDGQWHVFYMEEQLSGQVLRYANASTAPVTVVGNVDFSALGLAMEANPIFATTTGAAVDSDGDGLPDSVETGTGFYVSPTNTGTKPNNPDSDGDGYNDGREVTQGTDPNLNTSFSGIPDIERNALTAIYSSTNGAGWTTQTNWNGAVGTECTWYGVVCTNNHVTALNLQINKLTGQIPAQIGNLSALQHLDFNQNQLSGAIPPELGNLTSLQNLYLLNNQLTGAIPAALGNLTALQNLNLSNNQLTGAIPAALGNLSAVQFIRLQFNQLTGSIPSELGNLSSLQHFDINTNQVTGSIPPQIGNLSALQVLHLLNNQLTGTIPVELGNLSALQDLNLSNNQLTGAIPSTLGGLSLLQVVYLQNNRLTGAIPPALGGLTAVRVLQLASNQLTGVIPQQIGNLSALQNLYLSSNQLAGPIPDTLLNLTLTAGQNSFAYNALFTANTTLRSHLNLAQGSNWEDTQTIAPINLSATVLSDTTVRLTWAPIAYNADYGYYEVCPATTSGGACLFQVLAMPKTNVASDIDSLTPNATYYFKVRTVTQPHAQNTNTVISEWTSEVIATTTGGGVTDTDGDGIPDWYENLHGLNPTINDSALDLDRDGLTNLDEYLRGTNPHNADTDADGVSDGTEVLLDTNPLAANSLPPFSDVDEDGIQDASDNCVDTPNSTQSDMDGNGWGDACDDMDGDGLKDNVDPWPFDPQNDVDRDGFPADPLGICKNVCPTCATLKALCQSVDNCPTLANAGQQDSDGDGLGDACDSDVSASFEPPATTKPPKITVQVDTDGDGIADTGDNCKDIKNADQADLDRDGIGDACDTDIDGDGVLNAADNCPRVANPGQENMDGDGFGDACDDDIDGDGLLNSYEIQIGTSPTNKDTDGDGLDDNIEIQLGTSPIKKDTDGDGLDDNVDPNPLVPAAGAPPSNYIEISLIKNTVKVNDTWLPTLTWDVNAKKWAPEQLTLTAALKQQNGTPINYSSNVTFQIVSTTNFEGVAVNDIEQFTMAPANDFSFSATDRNLLTQTITNTGTSSVSSALYAFDFGGRVSVKVSTLVAGTPVEAVIKLPLDSDIDGLPDAWELAPEQAAAGFKAFNANSFSADKIDGDADIDTSLNNSFAGDGLTNFKEYRGVVFDEVKDASGAIIKAPVHKRLNPKKKDLFVRGDNFSNSLIKSYTTQAGAVLPFSVDYAGIYGVQGGLSAFEEAGLTVHDVTGMASFVRVAEPLWEPPNIDIVVVTNKTEPNATGFIELLGLGTVDGYTNHPYPSVPRYWTWDTKGASGIGDSQFYAVTAARKTETYHLNMMHYVFNRPYLNEVQPTNSPCYSELYNAKLDPLSNMEDRYLENGTNPPDRVSGKNRKLLRLHQLHAGR